MTEEPARQSAAAAAAERVRAIVEAAERSAAELEAAARDDADRIRGRATREADELVARARAAASGLADRAGELERELGELGDAARASIAALAEEARSGADRLRKELLEARPAPAASRAPAEATREGLPAGEAGPEEVPARAASHGEVPARGAVTEGPPVGEVAPVAAVPEADDPVIAEAEALSAREPEVGDPDDQPAAEKEAGRATAAGTEGARLIALNMALRGTPRDETARYLEENFELEDVDSLLDDVYARAR